MQRYDPTPPWKSYEVVRVGPRGRTTLPFSDALRGGGDPVAKPIGKMWLLGYHGWPQARSSMDIDRADAENPKIWILKAKPSCWRLYFHAYEDTYEDDSGREEKRILYLHAVCKRKNKRDPSDARRARRIFDEIQLTGGGSRFFQFPSN